MAIPIPKGPPLYVNLLLLNALAYGLLKARKDGLISKEQFEELCLHGLRQEDSQRLLKIWPHP